MNKLIVLSGVPGSGKSYFSNTIKKVMGSHVYIVSSDQLRTLIAGVQSDISQDELVWKMFYELAKVYALDKDGVVVLDATNYSSQYRINSLKEIKPLFNSTFLVSFDIEKQTVLNQNLQREFPIPQEVLDHFFAVFEKPTEEDVKFFDEILAISSSDIADAVERIVSYGAQNTLFDL